GPRRDDAGDAARDDARPEEAPAPPRHHPRRRPDPDGDDDLGPHGEGRRPAVRPRHEPRRRGRGARRVTRTSDDGRRVSVIRSRSPSSTGSGRSGSSTTRGWGLDRAGRRVSSRRLHDPKRAPALSNPSPAKRTLMRSPLRRHALLLFAVLCLPAAAVAQTAPLRQHTEPYALDSGRHDGAAAEAVAFRATVEVPGAPWLRLAFAEAHLGEGSYLTLTSRLDGAQQRLDAAALAEWYHTSAYFNGDAVEVALHVAPGDEGVYVRMEEVVVGEVGAPESQCGPTDDRQNSDDPRAGRLLSVGCTGWIIHENASFPGADQIVSAGHCLVSGASVLQFNVPLSTPGGGLQHPGPEDQ